MKQKHNIIVRQYLVKYGLRQSDLAEIMQVHKSTLSRWLNKKELPKEKQLELISVIQEAGEHNEQ